MPMFPDIPFETTDFELVKAQTIATATTTNGTGVDIKGLIGNALVLLSATGDADTTVDAKIQDSADNSTFADVAGAVFTQVAVGTSSYQRLTLNLHGLRQYVRGAVTTASAGTVSAQFAMVMVAGGAQHLP